MYLVIHHYINPITLIIYYLNRNKRFCKITFNPISLLLISLQLFDNYSLAIADALIDSHYVPFVIRPLSVNLSHFHLFSKFLH